MQNLLILSFKNKKSLEKSEKAGCFNCLEIFDSKKIIEWTDNEQTAICPKCKTDTVIASSDLELTKTMLENIKKYWL